MATVSKNDLAQRLAEDTGLSSGDAKSAVEKSFDLIVASVAAGDEVNLPGFGKFSSTERAARQGRNPQTGETIQIAASTSPKFSAASAFKNAVKG
jgi:DNA-binding protein HU-beta